jgi:methylated-DNA-[protein]-cysteine S-methyltransferase
MAGLGDDISELRKAKTESPIGTLTIVVSPRGLRSIYFPHHTARDAAILNDISADDQHRDIVRAVSQLDEYFSGDRQVFDVALDLVGTEFQQMAWRALAEVPYGQTATYAQQAAHIGRPKAVRAVGGANRMNPVPIVLPCHRIVGSNGSLTGFAGGLDTKQWLLHHEHGVVTEKM